ncbi:MAG: NAD(P)/FAD-dependent oxidoreductase [Isosphaeraceae bacterium]
MKSGRVYDETYDRLILAPGASPLRPPIPGIDPPGGRPCATSTTRTGSRRGSTALKHAVVVGAGFIGLEMAENLVRRGVETTVVELQDQVLPPLDSEMTALIARTTCREWRGFASRSSAEAFEPGPEGLVVRLKSGERLPAGLVVLGVGVRPESGLASAAGLEIGPRGGFVNPHMQTSDSEIYAVGDVVEVTGFVTGEPTQIPLAGPANRQGRIAADPHLRPRQPLPRHAGDGHRPRFDQTPPRPANPRSHSDAPGRSYEKIYIHPNQHAGYFPAHGR